MKIFYRTSDAGNIRTRVIGADNASCLDSFIKNFRITRFDHLFILGDSVTDETYRYASTFNYNDNVTIRRSQSGSEAASFKLLLDWFKSVETSPNEYVYFAENDYIYLPDSRDILDEGLTIGDYATLRLHPDKFIPPSRGGNPLLDEKGGENTRIYEGTFRFWMLTNSTGMYPATSAKIMREDLDLWYWGVQEKASKDFDIWLRLHGKGRSLVMPIPTAMCHSELESASSLIGTGMCCWEKALRGNCEHTTENINSWFDKYGP